MFDKLKQLCKEQGRSVSELNNKRTKIDLKLNQMLDNLMASIRWKGSKVMLIARIRKVGSQTKFSVRERKLLRELIFKQIEAQSVDFSKFEYYFPTKNKIEIKKESKLILQGLKSKLNR